MRRDSAIERVKRANGSQQTLLSWPGLTRPSMIKCKCFSMAVDGQVKPGHDDRGVSRHIAAVTSRAAPL
jgi:hypothetical protein